MVIVNFIVISLVLICHFIRLWKSDGHPLHWSASVMSAGLGWSWAQFLIALLK